MIRASKNSARKSSREAAQFLRQTKVTQAIRAVAWPVDQAHGSLKIARVRLDHAASVTVNANQGITFIG
jgi:hypothetical protein